MEVYSQLVNILSAIIGAILGWLGAINTVKIAHEKEKREREEECLFVVKSISKYMGDRFRKDLQVIRPDGLVTFFSGRGICDGDELLKILWDCAKIVKSRKIYDFIFSIKSASIIYMGISENREAFCKREDVERIVELASDLESLKLEEE